MNKTNLELAVFSDEYYGKRIKEKADKNVSKSEICEGNELSYADGKIKLIKELDSCKGGEGSIFETDKSGYVAKIYFSEKRTAEREKKLKLMAKYKNENKHVCWPTDVLYFENNGKREFVGFLMPYVDGKKLIELYDKPKKYGEMGFTREKQINMILEILKNFKYLNDKNILVGDINFKNIMFNENTYEICFVDMDSVQINEYNCGVTTFGYDAPEVVAFFGKDKCNEKEEEVYQYGGYYKYKYREKKHECFALATLIYQFLMFEFPYEYTNFVPGPVDLDENNILKVEHKFAYSNDRNKDASGNDVARYSDDDSDARGGYVYWSHLPSNLKNLFINAFSKNNRCSVDTWIRAFKAYKKHLKELSKKDKEASSIRPETEIDYSLVEIVEIKKATEKGFTIKQALRKISNKIEGVTLSEKNLLVIEDGLKKARELKAGNNFRFKLDYNIGVLKQITCEYDVL